MKRNQFKITPGPWRIQFMPGESLDDGFPTFWVKSDQNNVSGYGTDILADDYGEHNGYPKEQRYADAILVSAAPDMLELFQELIDLKEELIRKPQDTPIEHQGKMKQLSLLIAKIEFLLKDLDLGKEE